jgi:hypothetical protein
VPASILLQRRTFPENFPNGRYLSPEFAEVVQVKECQILISAVFPARWADGMGVGDRIASLSPDPLGRRVQALEIAFSIAART